MQYMVEEYKKLRQRDASSGSKSAWRITVRQLESLVRLSEAMARLHCADVVSLVIIHRCVDQCYFLALDLVRVQGIHR